jgi:CBS domain-containing protein
VAAPIYVSRLVRLPLLDADGMALGRIDDVVVVPSGPTVAPRVLGFVASVQRRGIFVNANRVEEIDASGVRLRGGTVDLRRLLAYEGNTAGGLMTPDPIILTADTTVAEALARIRGGQVPAAISAQVFVVEPPTAVPTGRFLGSVGFQRLLREPPMTKVGSCIDEQSKAVGPGISELEVARRLAAYDAIAVAVCDDAGRMLGAVTVDDVLDRVLPEGWRETLS